MDTVTKSLFERIAKMEAMGVSNVDIAKATNLTDERVRENHGENEQRRN